jgi:hypothetical protein
MCHIQWEESAAVIVLLGMCHVSHSVGSMSSSDCTVGHVSCVTYSGNRNRYRVLVGKRPLVEPRHKWEDNIKMYVK